MWTNCIPFLLLAIMIFLSYCSIADSNKKIESNYEILGLDEGVTDMLVIKKAYREMALKYHPDKSSGNKAENEEMLAKINQAYEQLTYQHKLVELTNTTSIEELINNASPDLKNIIELIINTWNTSVPAERKGEIVSSIDQYLQSPKQLNRDIALAYRGAQILLINYQDAIGFVVLVVIIGAIFSGIGVLASTYLSFRFVWFLTRMTYKLFFTVVGGISDLFRFIKIKIN